MHSTIHTSGTGRNPCGTWTPLALAILLLASTSARAQNFVAVTDTLNPIVTANYAGGRSYIGCAWVDIDNDGLIDLAHASKRTVFRNLGGGNFERLLNVIPGQGFWGKAMTWSDWNNDGFIDCFTSGNFSGSTGSDLYRNDGNFNFVKITTGDIGDAPANSGWGAAFGDFDNDSFTDLIIAAANGFGGVTHVNRLFHNNGDGTWTRVDSTVITDTLDAYTVPMWSDYDQDGDLDLFIGSGEISQLDEDNLYRNRLIEDGSWGFERITTAPIATDLQDGQVWSWIDYDNDGDLDAHLTNYGTTNRLYRNDAGTYVQMTVGEVGTIANEGGPALSGVWGDFDNDGDLDCFVSTDGGLLDDMWINNGDGTFTQDLTSVVVNTPGPHWGATLADYDYDGDLDLYCTGNTNTKRLYRNDLANGFHSINVKLVGGGVPGKTNRSALGCRVRVKATIDGSPVWQMREVSAQDSFNSMSMLNVHVGLGDATTIDSLVVEWVSGDVTVLESVTADQFITIFEVAQTGAPWVGTNVIESRLAQNVPNPFRRATRIAFEVTRSGPVELTVFDPAGRLVRKLVNETRSAGAYHVDWDGRDRTGERVSAGVYFYRLETVEGPVSRKAVRLE